MTQSTFLSRYVRRDRREELRQRGASVRGPIVCVGCGATVLLLAGESDDECPLCRIKSRSGNSGEYFAVRSGFILQLASDACPDCGASTAQFNCLCSRLAVPT